MNKKVVILWVLIYVITIGIVLVAIFVPEQPDFKLIASGIVVLISFTARLLLKRRNLGDYAVIVRKYRQAYADMLEHAFSGNSHSRTVLNQALVEMHCDEYAKAIARLDKLATQSGSNADDLTTVLYFRGLCYQLSGDAAACVKDWEELLRYRATCTRVWGELGSVYSKMERPDEAIRCFESGLLYDRENAQIYADLAAVYLVKKELPAKAISYGEHAFELNPTLYDACSILAIAYRSEGNQEKSQYYRDIYVKNTNDTGLDEALTRVPISDEIYL